MISRIQKHLIIIFLLITFTVSSNSIYKNQAYKAFVENDMKKWENMISNFEKQKPAELSQKIELISYYYVYIGHLIRAKKHDTANLYIEKGDKLINDVLKNSPKCATAYAYKGSFGGFKISLNKLKAFSLSSESNKNIEKALELEPTNIQAIVDKANLLFHTPSLFGGDKEISLKLFLKAVNLFEKHKLTNENWLYMNTLALLARNYQSLNHLQKAKTTYDKILLLEPEFKRVKYDLYPSLLKQLK